MNYDDRLRNRTRAVARCLAMVDRDGADVLTTIAKLTYRVTPKGVVTLFEEPHPIRIGDRPYSSETPRQVQYPSDFFDDAPGTSVVFVGMAFPPPRAEEHILSLRAGHLFKSIKMVGESVYTANQLGTIVTTKPKPLESTRITYGRAFGGTDDADAGDVQRHEKNPIGTGFAKAPVRMVGKPAPQFWIHQQNPSDVSTEPAGFGPIHKDWSPRKEQAGTRDADWSRKRAPVAPRDFDVLHHRAAHPDLYTSAPLPPDVAIEVIGATPEGTWRFKLPSWRPSFEANLLGQGIELATHVDTILIDGEEGTAELTWRASIRIPRKAEHLKSVLVMQDAPLPAEVTGEDTKRAPGDVPTQAEEAP